VTALVHRLRDSEAAARKVADRVERCLAAATGARGRASLAVPGGSTPRRLYEILSQSPPTSPAWNSTHLFWVDERVVPPTSEDSNYELVHSTLLVRGLVPTPRVHPIRVLGSETPREAARRYEGELRGFAGADPATFDVALLGLGPDGHTASLFPSDPVLLEPEDWVAPVARSPTPPQVPRITLTLVALNRARHVLFLVTGAEKRSIVASVLAGPRPGLPPAPAGLVRGLETTEWFLDEPAARDLASSS
jgi:6-phosphogluconolactonase